MTKIILFGSIVITVICANALCQMKKTLYLISYFLFAPLLLLLSVQTLKEYPIIGSPNFLINSENGSVLAAASSNLQYFSALPPDIGSVSYTVTTQDARPILIQKYLEKYKSPLLPYADYIFQVSQEYGLDHGIIIAIAQCESNVCKRIPEGSYNCWGFENGATRFNSWEHAIRRVAQTLKERYYDYGLITPDQIMPKYAPPSVEKGGPWARCVNRFLGELH